MNCIYCKTYWAYHLVALKDLNFSLSISINCTELYTI